MREAELVYGLIEESYTEGHVSTDFTRHLHYLRGSKGAVSFSYTFVTNPIESRAAWLADTRNLGRDAELWDNYLSLMATGVDVHSPEPLYPGQTPMPMCLALGRKTGGCYPDGSGLRAIEWLEEFQSYGMDWLMDALTEEYHYRFYPEDYELTSDEELDKMNMAEMGQRLGELLSDLG